MDAVSGESDTTNNCSGAVAVTATEGDPDLVVDAATTLRCLRSDDASESSEDTELGTDAVAALPLGSEGALSVAMDAPADAGTVHYGACVDAVSGESDPDNNCSVGAAVTVRE